MNVIKQRLLATFFALASCLAIAGEIITFIHTDHLGSSIAATNEDGTLKWRESYKPFGEQLTNEDTDNSVDFTGHLDDNELGLTYMQARWYHPDAGRFMATDALLFRDLHSFNRYTYANNNPYKYIDPDGREARIPMMMEQLQLATVNGQVLRQEYYETMRDSGVAGVMGLAAVAIGTRELASEAFSQITGIELPGVKSLFKKYLKNKVTKKTTLPGHTKHSLNQKINRQV